MPVRPQIVAGGTALAALLALSCAARAFFSLDLASADGRRWLSPGGFGGKPAIVLFWNPQCPPCLAELASLPEMAKANPGRIFLLAATGPHADARRMLSRHLKTPLPPNVRQAWAPADPRGLMARLGNRSGALPFSAAFDGAGTLCATHTGPIARTNLTEITKACGTASPRTR